jgi:hypothetical protein
MIMAPSNMVIRNNSSVPITLIVDLDGWSRT